MKTLTVNERGGGKKGVVIGRRVGFRGDAAFGEDLEGEQEKGFTRSFLLGGSSRAVT